MYALSKLRVSGLGKDPDRLLRLHPEQIRLQAVIQRLQQRGHLVLHAALMVAPFDSAWHHWRVPVPEGRYEEQILENGRPNAQDICECLAIGEPWRANNPRRTEERRQSYDLAMSVLKHRLSRRPSRRHGGELGGEGLHRTRAVDTIEAMSNTSL